MANTASALTGMFAGLVAAAIFVMFSTGLARADDTDELTRQIGLEMLRVRMIEQRADQLRQIDWTPPGYFLVGFTVRVG